jgi:hypothetical protein
MFAGDSVPTGPFLCAPARSGDWRPALVASEKWNGVLPSTMVPGNTVPFLNIAK